jgi:phage-related protein
MAWTVTIVDEAAAAELRGLSADLRAKFERIVTLIQSKGLEQVHEPYIKRLEGKLWEMRMIGRNSIARWIYITASGQRVVVLHTFVKKLQKTPPRALAIDESEREPSDDAQNDPGGRTLPRMAERSRLRA